MHVLLLKLMPSAMRISLSNIILIVFIFANSVVFANQNKNLIQCNFKNPRLKEVTRYFVASVNNQLILYSQEIENENGRIIVVCNNYYDKSTVSITDCKQSQEEDATSWLFRCLKQEKQIAIQAEKSYGLQPAYKQTKYHQITLSQGLKDSTQQEWWFGHNPRTNKTENYDFTNKEEMDCRQL